MKSLDIRTLLSVEIVRPIGLLDYLESQEIYTFVLRLKDQSLHEYFADAYARWTLIEYHDVAAYERNRPNSDFNETYTLLTKDDPLYLDFQKAFTTRKNDNLQDVYVAYP